MGWNDSGPVVGTTSGWKGQVTIFTVVSIFTGEAMTAAHHHSLWVQLCRPSEWYHADHRRCCCSAVCIAHLIKATVKSFIGRSLYTAGEQNILNQPLIVQNKYAIHISATQIFFHEQYTKIWLQTEEHNLGDNW